MKKYLILFNLLLGAVFSQNAPMVLTEPDTIEGLTFKDIEGDFDIKVLVPGSKGTVVIKDCHFEGNPFAFVTTGVPREYKDPKDKPNIKFIRCTAKGLDGGLIRPWFLEAGGGNTIGIDTLIVQDCSFETMGGFRLKEVIGSFIRFDYVIADNIDQAVVIDGVRYNQNEAAAKLKQMAANAVKTKKPVQLNGKTYTAEAFNSKYGNVNANMFTRQGIVIGADGSEGCDIIINYVWFKNAPPYYSTDIISIRGNADNVVFDDQGYAISSDIIVQNCMVDGNFHLGWNVPGVQQAGCSYIHDWDYVNDPRGGVIWRNNMGIGGSNTIFQHAAFLPSYYYGNIAVSDGYHNGQKVTWNGRGFGVYRTKRPDDTPLPHFRNNKSAFFNTRWANKTFDYATKRQTGGNYLDTLFNKPKPFQNEHLGDPTPAMEDLYRAQYAAKYAAAYAAWKAAQEQEVADPVIDPPAAPNEALQALQMRVDSLSLAIDAIKRESDQQAAQIKLLGVSKDSLEKEVLAREAKIEDLNKSLTIEQVEKKRLVARIEEAAKILIQD